MQSGDSSKSVIQKEEGSKKHEMVQKEGVLEGSKENMTPSSHTVSRQGEAEPSFGGTSGTLRQATNQDRKVIIVVPRVDVVSWRLSQSGRVDIRVSGGGDSNN